MCLATNYNIEFTRNLHGPEKCNGHSVEGITICCPIAFIETNANKLSRNAKHFTAIIPSIYRNRNCNKSLFSQGGVFWCVFSVAQHSVAVLQQRGSLGSTWKGAAAARWLHHKGERGSLPHPAPGGLLGGSFPPPGAGQALPSVESFAVPLPRTVLFRKPSVLGFSAFLRVGLFYFILFFLLFKDLFFLIEKESSVAQQCTGRSSATVSPAWVLGVAGPEIQPLDPMGGRRWAGCAQGPTYSCWCRSLCSLGVGMWTKGGLPPSHPWEGRCPQSEPGGGSTPARHQLPKPHQPSDPSPRSCRSWLLVAEDPQGGSVAEAETFLLLIQCEIIASIHVRKSSPWSSFGDMTEGLFHFCQR